MVRVKCRVRSRIRVKGRGRVRARIKAGRKIEQTYEDTILTRLWKIFFDNILARMQLIVVNSASEKNKQCPDATQLQ